jgi:signal transduction histidine kinase/DNA-binding NarL/FixJ family response regulator
MPLRPKITIGILSILLVTLLVAGGHFIHGERERYLDEIHTAGNEMATLVAEFCSLPIQKFSFFIVEEVARNVERSPQVAFCEIYDQNGESLLTTEARVLGETVPKKERRTGSEVMIVTQPIKSETGTIGKVEIGFRLEQIHQQLRQQAQRLAISVAVMLIFVALVTNLYLSLSFISPVVNLSQAAQTMAQGDFVEIPMEIRQDEIGGLARSFNQMSASLKQLYQGLEQKVAERTAELEAANRQLQREIGDRRQAQIELRDAKEAAERANAYKSSFIANISHEIRTPLNAILGYAQILQRRPNLDEAVRHSIDTIEGNGTHLLGLINDILDLSKIEAGKLEVKRAPFDLIGLLNDIGPMFELRCSQKALFWTIEGIDTTRPIEVTGDAGKLRQVLINLLDNALKFTARGGISLRVLPRGRDRFRFEVADTGLGMTAEARRVIFEPFTQVGDGAQAGGAGLGLAISRRFVELMGGRLNLASEPDQGTCFHFELTLTPAETAGQSKSAWKGAKFRLVSGDRPLTAVIADDDADNRAYLATVLQDGGLTVHTAAHGAEALEKIAANPPDIVFLDHYMPVLDGPQTIQRLRSLYKDGDGEERFKLVLVTAAAFTRDGEPLELLDVDASLIKPFKVQDVFECLAALLDVKLIAQPHPTGTGDPWLPPAVRLEPALLSRLMETAQFGKVSELKRIITELEAGAAPEPELGSRLRSLLNQYDLDGIVSLLQQMAAGGPAGVRAEDKGGR